MRADRHAQLSPVRRRQLSKESPPKWAPVRPQPGTTTVQTPSPTGLRGKLARSLNSTMSAEHPTAKAFLEAAARGDVDAVRQFLADSAAAGAEAGVAEQQLGAAALLAAVDAHGRTALHLAAGAGHEGVVKQLLAAGAPVNVHDTYPKGTHPCGTPLEYAAFKGYAAVVKQLILSGADATQASNAQLGTTVLHLAAFHGHVSVIQLLLGAGAAVDAGVGTRKGTALHIAASRGHTAAVEVLLAAGADVHAVTQTRRTRTASRLAHRESTALHVAAAKGRTAVVQALLAAGAAIDAVDWRNRTALHLAVASSRTAVVEALLAPGAHFDAAVPQDCHPWNWRFSDSTLTLAARKAACWEESGPLELLLDHLPTSTPAMVQGLVLTAMRLPMLYHRNANIEAHRSTTRQLLQAAAQQAAAAAQAAVLKYFPGRTTPGAIVLRALMDAWLVAHYDAPADVEYYHTSMQQMLVNVAAMQQQQQQQQELAASQTDADCDSRCHNLAEA